MFNNELWQKPTAAGATNFYDYQINNSLRLPLRTSGFSKTYSGSDGDDAHFTLSWWQKGRPPGHNQPMDVIDARDGTDNSSLNELYFADATASAGTGGDALCLVHASTGDKILCSTNLFRDPSAWYHFVVRADMDNATASERLKFYVNGTEMSYATDNRSSYSSAAGFGNAGSWYLFRYHNGSYGLYSNVAEMHYIDGTSLTPSSFGETKNGVWIPKEYDTSDGAYGTLGFYLKIESSSDLGNDSSGNNNDWTTIDLSAHDQMLDSPTFNSDSNGGNFATYNPLTKGSYTDLSEGNCRADSNTGADASYPSGNFAMTSGKWYYEQLIGNLTNSYPSTFLVACNNRSYDLTRGTFWAMRLRSDTGVAQQNSGDNIAPFGTITVNTTGVASVGTGDIVSWYVDMDNKKAWFAKNGTIPNSGDPANGTNPQFSWTENPPGGITFGSQEYQTSYTTLNAGQDGTFAGEKTAQGNSDDTGYGNFYYDPPTGFLALCSGNMPLADEINPAETDDDYPQKLFDAIAYSGDGGGSQTTGFQPDLVWVKRRNGDQSNGLFDSSRGTSKVLNSNSTSEEVSSSGLLYAYGP